LNPDSKRKYQLGIGFAIFAFAVSVSYFSVVEADTEDTPQYDIYLVIDVSGSMGTCTDGNYSTGCYRVEITSGSPIVPAKRAAVEFVDTFQLNRSSDHRIGLAIFHGSDSGNTPIAKIIVELGNNSKNLKQGIDSLYPGGGTAMGDGISIATQSLWEDTRPDAKKIIVLLSDGVSNVGSDPLIAAGIAKDNDVTIFSVAYGPDADVQTLKAVASITNGKYYNASTGQDLADTFGEIAGVLISPLSHYSSRLLILIAIPVLLFIPTIERGLTTMMKRAEDKPVERIVKPKRTEDKPVERIVKPKRTEDKPKAKIGKLKITCPNCNHLNRSTSKVCAKCGSTVKAKITCPNCNYVNRTTSKFCVKCGSTVKGRVT
jgi:hypothetical protein